MKYLYLSILLITLSCGGTKKSSKDNKKEETTSVKPVKNSMEELIVVLQNPKDLSSAKALVTNSGLTWEKLIFNQETLKIGLIKVPADKKDFWKKRLQEAGEFKSVEFNQRATINSIVEKENNTFLNIRKTACFGTCPVYEFFIDKNGNATFNGEDNVPKKGKYTFKLTEKELATITKMLNKKPFSAYKNSYDNPRITDLPNTFIKHSGKEVRIRIWKEVPDELAEAHEYIEGILVAKKYID